MLGSRRRGQPLAAACHRAVGTLAWLLSQAQSSGWKGSEGWRLQGSQGLTRAGQAGAFVGRWSPCGQLRVGPKLQLLRAQGSHRAQGSYWAGILLQGGLLRPACSRASALQTGSASHEGSKLSYGQSAERAMLLSSLARLVLELSLAREEEGGRRQQTTLPFLPGPSVLLVCPSGEGMTLEYEPGVFKQPERGLNM